MHTFFHQSQNEHSTTFSKIFFEKITIELISADWPIQPFLRDGYKKNIILFMHNSFWFPLNFTVNVFAQPLFSPIGMTYWVFPFFRLIVLGHWLMSESTFHLPDLNGKDWIGVNFFDHELCREVLKVTMFLRSFTIYLFWLRTSWRSSWSGSKFNLFFYCAHYCLLIFIGTSL